MVQIKKSIAYILSWIFYGLGDVVSRPMNWFDCLGELLYPVYNWLMLRSYAIQHWAGNQGPWKETTSENK